VKLSDLMGDNKKEERRQCATDGGRRDVAPNLGSGGADGWSDLEVAPG
jgi:hypothetical protein